jgi:hypothetical protein
MGELLCMGLFLCFPMNDSSPDIQVRANVAGRDVGSVVAEVKQRLQQLMFPLEYHSVPAAHRSEQHA